MAENHHKNQATASPVRTRFLYKNPRERRPRKNIAFFADGMRPAGSQAGALFDPWHKPEEIEDNSAAEIAYSHRVRRPYQ